jgi:hypothetical protein
VSLIPIAERFWAKVQKTDTCWLWTGVRVGKGRNSYGRLFVRKEGKHVIRVVASRFAWELFNGPVPDGLCVLHQCDVPACVNPSHLFLGTISDNNKDAARKGRLKDKRWVLPPIVAKLKEQDVHEIRKAVGIPFCVLARAFMVDRSTISRVRSHATWEAI